MGDSIDTERIDHEDPLRDAVRPEGKTGVAESTIPLVKGLGVDTVVSEVNQGTQKLTPVLTGKPGEFRDPNGVTYFKRTPVPIEQTPLGGEASEYGTALPSLYAGFEEGAALGQQNQPQIQQGRRDARIDALRRAVKRKPVIAGLALLGLGILSAVVCGALAAAGVIGGKSRPKAKDLSQDLPDPPQPVDFGDVLAANADTASGDAPQLLDQSNASTTSFQQVDTNNVTVGTWTLAQNHITFALATGYSLPDTGGFIMTQYSIVSGSGANTYDPGTLSVAFAPTAASIHTIKAPDRVSTVPVPVILNNPGFQGQVELLDASSNPQTTVTDAASGGAWIVDANNGVTFNPQPSVPTNVPSVTVPYVLQVGDLTSKTSQNLTILFPPNPIVVMDMGASLQVSIDVPGDNGNFSGAVRLWDGSQGVLSLPDTATGGTWKVDPQTNKILFTYPQVITSATKVTAPYVLVLNNVPSVPAGLEIGFLGVTPPPTPVMITIGGTASPVDVNVAAQNGNFAGTVMLWDATQKMAISSRPIPSQAAPGRRVPTAATSS